MLPKPNNPTRLGDGAAALHTVSIPVRTGHYAAYSQAIAQERWRSITADMRFRRCAALQACEQVGQPKREPGGSIRAGAHLMSTTLHHSIAKKVELAGGAV